MHQGLGAGAEIDDASHGAVRVDQAELIGLDEGIVGGDVGVVVHVGREGGGGVDDVEGHCVVDPGGPGAGPVGFDDGGARGVVAGDVVREAREAVGELGVVAGSGVGHGAGFLMGRWLGGGGGWMMMMVGISGVVSPVYSRAVMVCACWVVFLEKV